MISAGAAEADLVAVKAGQVLEQVLEAAVGRITQPRAGQVDPMSVNRGPGVLSGPSGTEGRAPVGGGVKGLSGWAPFAVASSALFVLLVGSNLPTPLFPLYAKAYGLSPLMVTLLFATMLAGAGHGLAFMGSLGDVSHMAPEDRKGDIVASYYVVVYVGTAIPVIGVGVLTETVGFLTAIQVFGCVMVAICLGGLAALVAELHIRRRSRQA